MAGRMGGKKVTTKNHALVSVSEKENLLIVKGAVFGAGIDIDLIIADFFIKAEF